MIELSDLDIDEILILKTGIDNIRKALTSIKNEYNVTPADVRLKIHQSGVYHIEVCGEPIIYFFSLDELVGWAGCR